MNLRVWGSAVGRPYYRCPGKNVIVTVALCLLFVLTGGAETCAAVEKKSSSPNSIAAKLAGDVAGKIHEASRHLDEIGKKDEPRRLDRKSVV